MGDSCVATDTIFAQFDRSMPLGSILQACASKQGKKVFWGETGSPDLLAVPSFLAIIDRMDIGLDIYRDFVDLTVECNDDGEKVVGGEELDVRMLCSCVFVDEHRDLLLPKLPIVIHLDLNTPLLSDWIDEVIRLASGTYLQTCEIR